MNLPVHPLAGQRVGYARISSASQNLDGQFPHPTALCGRIRLTCTCTFPVAAL